MGGAAEHFRLRVDTVALPPRLSSSAHPMDGTWSNRAKVQWSLEAPQDLSGIAGYWIVLDRKPGTLPSPENGSWSEAPSYSAELNADGDWYLHAASSDLLAGNVGREASHFLVRLDRSADPRPKWSPRPTPSPAAEVNSSNVELRWSPPADASGVAGYYSLFDQRPETVPTVHTGAFTLSTQASFSGRADGLWYFHIVTADQAGNIGVEAAHYAVRIDTWAAAPEISSPTHPKGTWVSASRAAL